MKIKCKSIRQSILKTMLILDFLVLSLTCALFLETLYQNAIEKEFDKLKSEALLISQGMDYEGEKYIYNYDTTNRVTWVNSDGTVLFDNVADIRNMENHALREEISEAYSCGEGKAVRYSKTLLESRLYYAVRNDDGSVIRVSVNKNTVIEFVFQIGKAMIVISGIIFLISAFLAWKLAQLILKPIYSIDLGNPEKSNVYIELEPLLKKIQLQNNTIQEQILQLELKQAEIEMIAQQEKEKLTDKAMRDSMTKFYNKKAAKKLIEDFFCTVGKDGHHALLFIDLDNFKSINDNFGHKEGDNALQNFAEIISASFNSNDIIVRYGGDEFIVLVKDYSSIEKLERLITDFSIQINNLGTRKYSCSASIGIALYPQDGDTYEKLLQKSDEAMYQSKKEGKNTHKFV